MLVTRKAVQMGHVLPRRTPDRGGAQRRLQRLRRVRRADRDRGPGRGPAGRLPDRRRHRAAHVAAARAAGPRGGTGAGRGRPPAAAPAAPAPGSSSASPQRRADLAGDRHRGRAADPAGHRRGADLRPQLRRPVAAGAGGRAWRPASGRPRSRRRRAVLRAASWCCWSGWAPEQVADGRADRRPADQLPGLRALHDRADPDVLRVRPEAHPGDGVGPAGRGRSSSSSRRGATPPGPLPLPDSADVTRRRLRASSPAHGQLTVVVSGVPEDSAALADRLGRYLPA